MNILKPKQAIIKSFSTPYLECFGVPKSFISFSLKHFLTFRIAIFEILKCPIFSLRKCLFCDTRAAPMVRKIKIKSEGIFAMFWRLHLLKSIESQLSNDVPSIILGHIFMKICFFKINKRILFFEEMLEICKNQLFFEKSAVFYNNLKNFIRRNFSLTNSNFSIFESFRCLITFDTSFES